MDAFAAQSLLFQRAYVQYSYCAPSRTRYCAECVGNIKGPSLALTLKLLHLTTSPAS